MTTVADFFKTSVADSLAKLVQPSGLVPAAAIVLANLAWVYPTAQKEKLPGAVEFASLSEGWRVVTIAVVVFALGLVFFTIAGVSVDVLAGQVWRGSALGRFGRRLERGRLQRLVRSSSGGSGELATRWRVSSQFPVKFVKGKLVMLESLEPTRLGNVLVAAQTQIRDLFGVDIAALGQHLQASKDLKEAPALSALRDERAALDLLANLVVVAVVLWLELVAFNFLFGSPESIARAYILLPLAYLVYRLAVVKARGWGTGLAVLVALHRDDLRKALSLRARDGADDDKDSWKRASSWYLPGGGGQPGDLFGKESAPTVKTTAPPGVDVAVVSAFVDGTPTTSDTTVTLRRIRYRFLLTATSRQARATAQLFMDDPRIDRLPSVVPAESGLGAGTPVLTADRHQGVRWTISALAGQRSLDLAYELPLAQLRNANGTQVKAMLPGTYELSGHGGVVEVELYVTPKGLNTLPLVQDGADVVRPRVETYGVSFSGLTNLPVQLIFPEATSFADLSS